MVVKDGPLKYAIESEDSNIIKQELITYKIVDDRIVKETVDRRFLENGDYIDSTSQEPLMRKRYAT
tara:strand:- start:1860 stop:2057 length:198 start_codon:yes stop_codon:yes gene_type:complete